MSERPRTALQAAGVGHRITHDDDLPEALEIATRTLAHAERSLQSNRRTDPKLALSIGAALAWLRHRGKKTKLSSEDAPDGSQNSASREEQTCPSPCGQVEKGSENTFIGLERRAVALVGHEGPPCDNHGEDPIRKGSANVWVNGKRLARRTDETECGALIGEGEPTVWIGAETEAEGERTVGDKAERFVHSLIGDLASGRRIDGPMAAQHLIDAIRGRGPNHSKTASTEATALGQKLSEL